MLLRKVFPLFGVAAALAAFGAVQFRPSDTQGYGTDKAAEAERTLALAPISLGNPTTAKRPLSTSVPGTPEAPAADSEPATAKVLVHQTVRAKRGDTLAGLLVSAGATRKEAHAAIETLRKHFNPRKFRQGQAVTIAYRPDRLTSAAKKALPGEFRGLSLRPGYDREIRISKGEDGTFSAEVVARPLSSELATAGATIGSSLYVAGKNAGLPDTTLAELIRAYSWDVDFQRDIRKGDSFRILYETLVDDTGNVVRSNKILFAELVLRGKPNTVYRFDTANGHTGYFNEKGQSARKALMRTPIDGARLSSGYGRRKHPILGYTKMHRGVDFAAPRGTPIYAAGNGVVTYAARNGGYGKYIRIRHNSEYSTAYAHLKGYARGIRKGKRINQGQIIGYVGSTGRSTGPHLHYEILKGGRQTNPLRVRMPSGEKLKGDELKRFRIERARIDHKVARLQKADQVAEAKE